MGVAKLALLVWLIGAGLTIAFVIGYLGLVYLTDRIEDSRTGLGVFLLLIVLAPLAAGFFLTATLAMVLHRLGLNHALPIALLAAALAGITIYMITRYLESQYPWDRWGALLLAAIVGTETVVSMVLVSGLARVFDQVTS